MSSESHVTIGHDAIALIQETAVKAAEPKILTPDGEPPDRFLIAKPDGSVETFHLSPPLRQHELSSVASLVNFVDYLQSREVEDQPVIWLNHRQIVVSCDDGQRRDYAYLSLEPTPQLRSLMLKTGDPRSQPDFIRFLRIELDGTLPDGSNLLSLVRNLKWTGGRQTQGEIHHGKESMGHTIDAQVHGASVIPETVTLQVRIYDVTDITFIEPIRCAVEILPHEEQFRLTPMPLEIDTAIHRVLDKLQMKIIEGMPEKVPVFMGLAVGASALFSSNSLEEVRRECKITAPIPF